MKPTLVILAAGMGSRYGSLKQIDKFGPSGETIIDYSIYDAINSGFGKVVFVIRRSIENEFKEVIGKRFEAMVDVEYVFQELDILPSGFEVPNKREKPWGTAHAVLMAADVVKEPFAIINGDDFYGQGSFKLMFDYLSQVDPNELHGNLIGYILKNTLSDNGKVSRGVCAIDVNNKLQDITERTEIYKKEEGGAYFIENNERVELTGEEIVSMNLMGFTPKVFELINSEFVNFLKNKGEELKSEFYIPSILDKMQKNGIEIPVILTNDEWFGVTYKEDKETTKINIMSLVDRGVYPKALWE